MNLPEHRFLLTCLLCVGLTSCSPEGHFEPIVGPGMTVPLTIQAKTGEVHLDVEVAADPLAQQVGMMYRKPEELPPNRGMLFVYKRPRKLGYYMKDTLVPLSIAFIDDAGEIRQIEKMKPKDESTTVSKEALRFALEVHQGWFQENGIQVGDRIKDFADLVGTAY